MIASLVEVLGKAQRRSAAVGHFNIYNLETIQAVVAAAHERHAPVVLAISEKSLAYGGETLLVHMAREAAQNASIPVVVHLDHGRSPALARRALSMGFSSIHFDASALVASRRARTTSELVFAAQAHGISVEGEFDSILGVEDDVKSNAAPLTDPLAAQQFTKATRVDCLAVSVGNAHGLRRSGEKLNIKQIELIAKSCAVPLVLHGASSTPTSELKQAIQAGIRKVNVDTDLRVDATNAIRADLKDPRVYDPRVYLADARKAMQKDVEHWLERLGWGDRRA